MDSKQLHNVLLLFAYETYSSYRANRSVYGELTPIQEFKLRQLSVVSLASHSKTISYADLKEELSMNDERELEDLLMDTIYAGLVGGKLDSKNELLRVEFAIGRDVRLEDLEEIRRVLISWQERAQVLVALIESKVDEARGMLQQDAMLRGEHAKRVAEVTEKVAKMQIKRGGDGSEGDGGFMFDGGGGGGGAGMGFGSSLAARPRGGPGGRKRPGGGGGGSGGDRF